MGYVVERFHGRSLVLAHSQEEIEEIDLKNNDETLIDKKFDLISYFHQKIFDFLSKLIRHGTYRVRKSRMIPSIYQQDEIIQSLTQSTINKQKLIDETTRKVKDAECKAQDLSINIQ